MTTVSEVRAMRSLIFFFQSPVNGSFRDQFEKLNGELLGQFCRNCW